MFLVFYYETIVHKNKKNGKDYLTLVSNILKIRHQFFKSSEKTILDKTIFQEFKMKCKGKTIVHQREAMIRYMKRAEKKIMIKWKYNPGSDKTIKKVSLPLIDGLNAKNNKK